MLQELFPIDDYQAKEYSFSKIQLFKQCGLRYKYKYLDNKLDNDQRNTFYLSVGRFSHNVLKDFLDPKHHIRPDIEALFKKYWINSGFVDNTEQTIWFSKAKKNILRFIDQEDLSKETICVEASFKSKSENYYLTTKIDRINSFDSTYCEIIEYKFGEENTSSINIEENLQWLFHYLASYKDINERYGKEIAYIKYCFLDSDNTFFVFPTYSLIEKTKNTLLSTIDTIESEKDFSPKINKFCCDCRFDMICPLMKNKGGINEISKLSA